jgi:pantoate--beta-alanine ligase
VHLSPEQRKQATVLYRALSRIQTLADSGERHASALLDAGKQVVAEEPEVRLDYLAVVNIDTLEPIDDVSHGALVPIAAYVGTTRLIDNVQLYGVGEAHKLVR